jgi:hypothetical protein
MKTRTIEEENDDAFEQRKKRIAELTGISHTQLGPARSSVEEKLTAAFTSSTFDEDINYDEIRPAKNANTVIKLDIAISQQQQEQQQEQQQQQQQQQQQVSATQQTREPPDIDYEPYQGYRNLISIQKFDHGKKTDSNGQAKLVLKFGSREFQKLTYLAGTHDSETGGIGYVTIAAATEILNPKFLPQFVSGLYLDSYEPEIYLPDGFCLALTQGERHLAALPQAAAPADSKEAVYDRREYKRLVLHYKPETKDQKKHPFRFCLIAPPAACEIIGTPAQFGISGGKSVFEYFRMHSPSIPDFNRIADAKKILLFSLRKQDAVRTAILIDQLGGMINYAAHHGYTSLSVVTIEATLKQLHENIKDSQTTRRNLFFEFMQGDNREIAGSVIKRFKNIFDLVTLNDISGLFDILFSAGCVGLEIFLSKMQTIFDLDNGETYFYLQHSFLAASPNWEEFLNDKALQVFDKIIALTPIQRTWWNALSSRHILNCGWSDLSDLFGSFEFFWTEYRRIGIEKMGADHFIELAAEYSLGSIGNMKVVLPRLLSVLENSRNFQEQSEHLHGINFNSNDVMYASAQQDYSLITGRMHTDSFKSVQAERDMARNKIPDSDIVVTFEELLGSMHSLLIVTQLYKYIGTQDYSAPYNSYLEMLDILYVSWNEKALARIQLNTELINRFAFILLTTTTNKRGCQDDLLNEMKVLYPYFVKNFTYFIGEIFNRMIALIKGARWISLEEIMVVGRIFFNVSYEQQKFLTDAIIAHKEEYIQHILLYDKNPLALDAPTFVEALFILNDDKTDLQLAIKLPRVLALIQNKNYQKSTLKKLIPALKYFENKQGRHAYNELIDILSILKLIDSAGPRPSINDFLTAINAIDKGENTSIKQSIAHSLPPNCTYNPADCRSIILPPRGAATVLKSFRTDARRNGIQINPEELESPDVLSYIVRISSEDADSKWRGIAREYILTLQQEKLKEHEKALHDRLTIDKDHRILNAIVHDIFPPGPFEAIQDSLVPMHLYTQQVGNFIDALIQIMDKWPDDISDLLEQICGDPTPQSAPRSIKFLNDFLCQVTLTFSKKLPFPNDFFALLLAHEKAHGIKQDLLAIDIIFGAKGVSREHKMALLKLNLDSAAVNDNAVGFIKNLLTYHSIFAPVFSRLFSIIEYYNESRQLVFECTLVLLGLLQEINNERFTEKMFALLVRNPDAYLSVVHSISSIPVPAVAALPKLPMIEEKSAETPVSVPAESQPAEPLPETPPDARQIITRLVFQCCDTNDFNSLEIAHVISRLACEDHATLYAIIAMRPSPTFQTLKIVLSQSSCKEFLKSPTDALYCYRLLDKQFDISRAVRIIEEIKDMNRDKPLFYSKRRKLLLQFLLVNRMGYHQYSPIYLRNLEGIPLEVTAKDLTASELKELVIRTRLVVKDKDASVVNIENARLVFITLVREAMWQITRKFPFSTQVISVINSVMHRESLLAEIDTGEGKGMIMAMMAACLWFEGEAVNVCTSNLELARVAFEEFAPVFDLLGIPRARQLVTSQTAVTEYCYDGINYSDISQLSLFIAKQQLDPYFIKYCKHILFSLALDEADYTFFDDSTHYRYATFLHQNDIGYVFKVLYDFIQADKFKNKSNTIRDDIVQGRQLLLEQAATLGKDIKDVEFIKALSDRQIDTWLDSALAASRLEEGKDFVVRTEARGSGEDVFNVSFARILANSRVSEGAEWSNGVHQFTHTRLNLERINKQWRIPEFRIEPETAPIASVSSRNVIEYHMQRGRVIGVTGTAGSRDELMELADQGIRAFRIPPHHRNARQVETMVLSIGEGDHFTSVINSCLRHLRQREVLSYWGAYEADDKPQPLLLGFNMIKKSQKFYDYLSQEINTRRFSGYKTRLRTQLVNGSTTLVDGKASSASEEELLSNGGVAGGITVSTILDRGADFKPRLHVNDIFQNHPCGLFALQTFPASERLSRQFAGRPARQGHVGQYQLNLDQKEFDSLPAPYNTYRDERALHYWQKQYEAKRKTERRFADRLAAIKNYFFQKYIRYMVDENNSDAELTRKWANCLSNMDIEWNRLKTQFLLRKFTEEKLLAECTSGLIRRACKDWNFLVPDDARLMLRPVDVLNHILGTISRRYINETPEDDYDGPLGLNDVSPARFYLENSPLYVTVGEEHVDTIKTVLESKRLCITYDCIGQIFEEDMDGSNFHNRLPGAFLNLISKGYVENTIPYKKKLVEIYALGRWSNNSDLQLTLQQVFLNTLYKFALKKTEGLSIVVIDRNSVEDKTLNKKAKSIVALLNSLNLTKDKLEYERLKELDDMHPVQARVTQVVTTLTDYFYESQTVIIEKLIQLINYPFTWEKAKLDDVFDEAQTNIVYMNSWCGLFKMNHPRIRSADEEALQLEYSFCEPQTI